jgi:hypothetical protein
MFRIGARITLPNFRSDPIVRRPVTYAIQTISEAVRHIADEWLAQSKFGLVLLCCVNLASYRFRELRPPLRT